MDVIQIFKLNVQFLNFPKSFYDIRDLHNRFNRWRCSPGEETQQMQAKKRKTTKKNVSSSCQNSISEINCTKRADG